MVAPLAMLGLVLGKKKKRGKWDTFIALLVVCVVVGMSVSACGPDNTEPAPAPIETPKPEGDSDANGSEPTEIPAPTSPPALLPTPTEDLCGYSIRNESIRYDIIVFGGSKAGRIKEQGWEVPESVGMWVTDNNGVLYEGSEYAGNRIFEGNLKRYPGYANIGQPDERAGKAIQAESARGISPCDSVILIGYSAGTESSLMYAKWRVEQRQNVKAVVLLGPTFGSYDEDGRLRDDFGNLRPVLTFGVTEIIENKNPIVKYDDYNDWADYITFLLMSNVNIYVFADSGTDGETIGSIKYYEDNIYPVILKSEDKNIGEFKGDYQPDKDHSEFTRKEITLKKSIYTWLGEP